MAFQRLTKKEQKKVAQHATALLKELKKNELPETANEKRVRAKAQLISWHTTEKYLVPHARMVRELHLMSIVVRRDWMSDDTTIAQDEELSKIAEAIRKCAKRLHRVFDGKH